MLTEEFSNKLDILTQAYSNGIIFDEYEKSLFLTEAQNILILKHYKDFEVLEFSREILAPLIKTYSINQEYNGYSSNIHVQDLYQISDNSFFYKLPNDLFLITFEEVVINSEDKCLNNKRLIVVPTSQDKLHHLLKNPFKGPNENRALRLNISDNVVEIITKYDIKSYYVRYIKKPSPIIVTTLTDGLTINGISSRTECILPEIIHDDILNLAFQIGIEKKSLFIQNNNEQEQTKKQEQTN